MKKALLGLGIVAGLIATLGVSAVSSPKDKGMKAFPPAGLDLINHRLKIELWKVGANGQNERLLETLKFEGRMLIERRDAKVNADGFRQIDFVVKNWEAFSWSNTLDTLITYRLTEGVPQKLSHITAQQKDRDFPARFSFSVTFNAVAYGEIFIDQYEGRPDEPEFYEVPPSGNRATSPTLRGFEATRVEMDHPALGHLRFVPVECNDSSGETIVTYPPGNKPKV